MTDTPESRDDEVDRIIAAAWDVLNRTGYENLKVQVVIRLAGVSIGSFYRHFSGKQELMAALLEAELARATAILDELTATGTPEERVAAWVEAVVSLSFGRKAGPRAKWFTSMPKEVSALVDKGPERETGRPLREAIADGVASGVFSSPDPRRDAFLIQAMCSRLDRTDASALDADREAAVAYVVGYALSSLTNPLRGKLATVADFPEESATEAAPRRAKST